ncbi:EamA family transporter [Streptomyces griseoluteus]
MPVGGLAEQGPQFVGVLVGGIESGLVVVLGDGKGHARVYAAGCVVGLGGEDGGGRLSPVTALISAMLPVGVGLLQGEHLGLPALIGLPLALAAVVLVSAGHGAKSARPSHTALLLAFGAGAAIALQLVFLHQAPSDSGVGPLIVGRAVSCAVTLAAAGVMFRRLGPEKPAYAASATAGGLGSVANLLFLLAARNGDLAIVAVITALYPAGTVLLARSVFAARFHRGQLIGLGAAAVSLAGTVRSRAPCPCAAYVALSPGVRQAVRAEPLSRIQHGSKRPVASGA